MPYPLTSVKDLNRNLNTQKFHIVVISSLKQHFTYLSKIKTHHRNILLAIDEDIKSESRVRRGFSNNLSRLANVLSGVYSNLDTEFIFNKITEFVSNKLQDINLTSENTRITRGENNDVNETIKHITEYQQRIENNIEFLQLQNALNIEDINKLMVMETILELAYYTK